MSMVMRASGANFSSSGLPKLIATRFGMPKKDLKALYLMTDGVAGSAHVGAVKDFSGNELHASVKSGWSQPTQRDWGYECGAGGVAIETPLTFATPFSVVLVAAFNQPTPASTIYPWLLGRTESMPSAPGVGASPVNGYTFINAQISSNGTSSFGISNTAGIPAGGVSRQSITGAPAAGAANAATVIGLSFDGASVVAKTARGSYSGPRSGLFGSSDHIGIGLMNYQTETLAAGGKLMLAAVYESANADALDTAMAMAREIVAGRGILVT